MARSGVRPMCAAVRRAYDGLTPGDAAQLAGAPPAVDVAQRGTGLAWLCAAHRVYLSPAERRVPAAGCCVRDFELANGGTVQT